MAENQDTAMVDTRPEVPDPILKSIPKYKKGRNVDYRVLFPHFQWLIVGRKSKTKNFAATFKSCNRRSVK